MAADTWEVYAALWDPQASGPLRTSFARSVRSSSIKLDRTCHACAALDRAINRDPNRIALRAAILLMSDDARAAWYSETQKTPHGS